MKDNILSEKEWLKWKETMLQERDFPDKQPVICKYFNCAAALSLEERLCGEFCRLHSHLPKKQQPHGPEDPVRFSSY